MKTYQEADNEEVLLPGVYSIYYKPHFNDDDNDWLNESRGRILRINRRTSPVKLRLWMTKMYSTKWILPPRQCSYVEIYSINRLN